MILRPNLLLWAQGNERRNPRVLLLCDGDHGFAGGMPSAQSITLPQKLMFWPQRIYRSSSYTLNFA